MSQYYSGEVPERISELGQSYLQLLEGLALGDPFQAAEASRRLRDADVPQARPIERLTHTAETTFLETKAIPEKTAKSLARLSIRSMVYSGNFDTSSNEHVNSIKTSLALLKCRKSWLKGALGLYPEQIEEAGYTEKGFGKDARKIGKQALKILKPDRRHLKEFLRETAKISGFQMKKK